MPWAKSIRGPSLLLCMFCTWISWWAFQVSLVQSWWAFQISGWVFQHFKPDFNCKTFLQVLHLKFNFLKSRRPKCQWTFKTYCACFALEFPDNELFQVSLVQSWWAFHIFGIFTYFNISISKPCSKTCTWICRWVFQICLEEYSNIFKPKIKPHLIWKPRCKFCT